MIEGIVTAAIILLLLGAGFIFVARAKAGTPTEPAEARFSRFRIVTALDTLFFDLGSRTDFDPAILKGIAQQESALGKFREGPSGELGLMQIHPVNFGRRPGATEHDWRTNDRLSIEVATEILGDARRRFGNDPQLYLSAYNWGETRLARHLSSGGMFSTIPSVVQEYVGRVTSFARSFGSTFV